MVDSDSSKAPSRDRRSDSSGIPHLTIMTSRVFAVFIVALSCYAVLPRITAVNGYSRAVIESCPGCSLNRLPDVKQFIFEDVPHYDRVQFKRIQGAVPELVLYDNNEEVVERLQLSRLTRQECNRLLESKGFRPDSKPPRDEI